ncbi:twin-arginine translocation signal domain-containing protein [Sulfuracidifex tepidarius]|uniref:Uncharacterized protein n=1 Tax=Sulfuracidifex tepidarius TaxID=1294262 RepID=A0A510E569_9CREN|nr:twin-arginine translocation signal domain-containing protein [Sulfuracidifex tepidarius]BBG27683.1 hypothetical protein IC007_2237 [Sulfuracidifex tepidarius]
MSKISRREFIGLLGVGAVALGSSKLALSSSPSSEIPSSFFGSSLAVVFSSSQQCKAIGSNGEVIFSGTCSDGSGTCGIYEAMQYVNQNFGAGKVDLIGEFYPTSSPSPIPNVELDGNAVIYLSPVTFHIFLV